ncbi:MAG: LptE family protein [candidate division WOR-3 bacterium]
MYNKLVLIILLTLSLGCGYTLLDKSSVYSENGTLSVIGKRVFVYPFKSKVKEPLVEVIFTNKLIESFMKSGIILSSPEDADYIVNGEISGYSLSTMAMSKTGEIGVYRLRVTVNVAIRDREGKVIFNRSFADYEDYPVETTIEFTKSREREAQAKISERIAQLLVLFLK